ncbi:conserved hypothetical protein [Heliomicrobium modesticaldum Ice1]|uniref:Threonine/serine exporter-like N-terminal domain-containing protein n=1 Tax=Heliobacterium modesticaldum (strain ATCC 51547 / Ice1) TaxID=498761 RepID=B0TDI3_HELMI|nr:threonine/serine exporter family protein [Heliomicrobium modesticaldum]ABZ85508.1 conserved hypothetical protein [Heliomicrobium modesticaldum Ice1]
MSSPLHTIMNRATNSPVNGAIEFIVNAGRVLLESSAEVYRVQDTVQKMGNALGVDKLESYVTPAGVFVSYIDGEGNLRTFFRRVAKRQVNLDRIAAINHLSRQVARRDISLDQAFSELKEIENTPPLYSPLVKLYISAVTAAGIAAIFGGGWTECGLALLMAFLAFLLVDGTKVVAINYLRELLLGAVGTGLVLAARTTVNFDIGPVVVGVLLSAIPGAYMVNSVRDIIAGDLISGTIRGLESSGLTAALFGGAGITLALVGTQYLSEPVEPQSPIIAVSFFVSALFSVYNQAPPRTVVSAGLTGMLSATILYLTVAKGYTLILGMFWGAIAVAVASEVLARIHLVPVTVFIVGGFVPLIPGIWFFRATQFLFTGNYLHALEPLIVGVGGIAAVGAGVAIVTAVMRHWKQNRWNIRLDWRYWKKRVNRGL